jgi:plasmid stabilization system protein ParE
MKPRIEKRALAEQDLREQAEYIRQHSPRSALRFLEAAEQAFHDLAQQARLGYSGGVRCPAYGGAPVLAHSRLRKTSDFLLSEGGWH